MEDSRDMSTNDNHEPTRDARPRVLTIHLPASVVEVLGDVADRLRMAPGELVRELVTRWALKQGGPRVPEVRR